MEITDFNFPVELHKSGEEKNGRVPVTIIPSVPTFDKVNDKIILNAFNKSCIDSFLSDGYLDWDHVSILGKTPLQKAEAILGQPQKMYVDIQKQVPVCEGFLFANNPYVKNVIRPALESNAKTFGASLGGKILKSDDTIDDVTKKKGKIISKISLRHIALTPTQKSVSHGTSVSLRKSFSEENIEEREIIFDKYETFIKSFSDPEVLQKAMTAGAATDVAGLSGGQAVQSQSLEGANEKKVKIDYKKIKSILPFVLESILNKNIGSSFQDYTNYLLRKGLNKKEAMKVIKLVAKKGSAIVKLAI